METGQEDNQTSSCELLFCIYDLLLCFNGNAVVISSLFVFFFLSDHQVVLGKESQKAASTG